jgi:hypothetical protein
MNTLAHANPENFNAAASWWHFLNIMGMVAVFLGGIILTGWIIARLIKYMDKNL